MTELTKSNLNFLKPLKKQKDRSKKNLMHRPTLSAHKNDEIGDKKYGPVDRNRTRVEILCDLDAVNAKIEVYSKPVEDPRPFSSNKEKGDDSWKVPGYNLLIRQRGRLMNELTATYNRQEYASERRPVSYELSFFLQAAFRLRKQIEEIPAEMGAERTDKMVAWASRRLEELQAKINELAMHRQPYGDSEVTDCIQEAADNLYKEWRRVKQK